MKRIKGLDFARGISALGIVAFHFYCHSSSASKLFYTHANGSWGGMLNYLFFALSGLVIQLRYGKQERLNVTQFYYSRWKATMPAYVLVCFFAYLMNVTEQGTFFYRAIPRYRILLSLIGMDGYIGWSYTNF